MTDFISDKDMAAMENKSPDFISDEEMGEKFKPESEPVERIKVLGNALNEAVPFSPTINRAIDYLKPGSANERLDTREAYSEYLKNKYPKEAEYANLVSQGIMLPGRMAAGGASAIGQGISGIAQTVEPLINQGIGYGHHLFQEHGIPLPFTDSQIPIPTKETLYNSVPLGIEAGLNAPGIAADTLAKLKLKRDMKPSYEAYKANPSEYDAYEKQTGGAPREALVTKMRDTLGAAQEAKQSKLDSIAEAMQEARQGRSEAQASMVGAKKDITSQQKNELENARQAVTLGSEEGDAAKEAIGDLQHKYQQTAMLRNGVLEHEGITHPMGEINEMFRNADRRTYDPTSKQTLQNARDNLNWIAAENGDPTKLPSRAVDAFRQSLQKNIPYGTGEHWTPAHVEMHEIAGNLNKMLDDSIPVNNPIRAQLRRETQDYQSALSLLGGNKFSNVNAVKKALSDPMTRRVIDDLNLPGLKDASAKIDAAVALSEAKRRGIKPPVPAEKDLEQATKSRQDYIKQYLQARQSLAKEKSNKLPLTKDTAESALNTAMISNEMHPRVGTHEKLGQYADTLHPNGSTEFFNEYHKNKVLRDLSTADSANGSRFTMLGATLGAGVGTPIGHIIAGPTGSTAGGTMGAAAGGGLGAYLDYNASAAMRDLVKKQSKLNRYKNVSRSNYNAISQALNNNE